MGWEGALKVIVTCSGPFATTFVRGPPSALQSALRSIALSLFIALKVYATSAAVRAVPSFHFAPLRIVNVSVLKPLDHLDSVASIGTGAFLLCRMFTYCSGSDAETNEVRGTAGMERVYWDL